MSDIKFDGEWVNVEGFVLKSQTTDFMLDHASRRTVQGGHRRALVHDFADGLTVNWANDYPGGVTINGNLTHTGNVLKTNVLRLGDKFRMSGVGDGHGNDDWLRLFNVDNTNYYGGLAAGRLWTSSGALSGSDLEMKRDVTPLPTTLDKLMHLRGVEFSWKHEHEPGPSGRQIGLIAQEVESQFPELVGVGPNGLKGIKYDGFTAVMIEAMKQQQTLIDSLRQELDALRHTLGLAGAAATAS